MSLDYLLNEDWDALEELFYTEWLAMIVSKFWSQYLKDVYIEEWVLQAPYESIQESIPIIMSHLKGVKSASYHQQNHQYVEKYTLSCTKAIYKGPHCNSTNYLANPKSNHGQERFAFLFLRRK